MQQNEPAVRELKGGANLRTLMQSFAEFLTDEGASLPDQIRARVAIISLHVAHFAMRDLVDDEDELQAAALEVALSLIPDDKA
jgi:hypothetical protein